MFTAVKTILTEYSLVDHCGLHLGFYYISVKNNIYAV